MYIEVRFKDNDFGYQVELLIEELYTNMGMKALSKLTAEKWTELIRRGIAARSTLTRAISHHYAADTDDELVADFAFTLNYLKKIEVFLHEDNAFVEEYRDKNYGGNAECISMDLLTGDWEIY